MMCTYPFDIPLYPISDHPLTPQLVPFLLTFFMLCFVELAVVDDTIVASTEAGLHSCNVALQATDDCTADDSTIPILRVSIS